MLLAAATASAGEPAPAVEIRAVRPDRQCHALLSLFEGAAWPHPAAALADWKRAAPEGEARSLGKPLEALIAAINPLMARELATLDGSRLLLDPDEGGRIRWAAIVPGDDGTIASLATALVLTDGARLAPEGRFVVDRLGPSGSPLVATAGRGDPVLIAPDRAALARAIRRSAHVPAIGSTPDPESGWIARVDPAALAGSESLAVRRVAEGLLGLGIEAIEAWATLEGETLEVAVSGMPGGDAGSIAWGAIDPGWLDPIPIGRAAAALSVAAGPGAGPWAALLDAADRADRADPERGGLAPLRQRVALLALVRGARLDADLWPFLRGATLWASVDGDGRPDAALLALHAADEAAADRIDHRVVSRIAGDRAGPAEPPGAIRPLGRLGGEPLEVARVGPSVLIGWGAGVLEVALEAAADPERSAGPLLRASWGDRAPGRLGVAWPGRLPWGAALPGPVLEAIEPAPPVLWLGWSEGPAARDLVRWGGLRDSIRRFLDRLPAGPEPDDPPRGPPNPLP